MLELKELRGGCTDHRVLAKKINDLGEASEFFAVRRMNRSIKSALVGQDIDEME